MKKYTKQIIFLIGMAFCCLACKPKQISQSTPTPVTDITVQFLDSLDASKSVLIDNTNQIFSRLTKVDMCIQMKGNCQKGESKESILNRYKKYLQEDVTNFTEEEINWLGGLWAEAVNLCNVLNKNILPANVKLIKSKGTYYGEDAFYTRENCIVIPSERIAARESNAMLSVLLHEIFHLYSREKPDKQAALYNIIGFEKIGDSRDLLIDAPLKERILSNPDGPNFAYGIDLTSSKGDIKCIPIISSTLPGFVKEKGEFFDYLYFDLFEVQKQSDGKWKVLSNDKGQAMVPDDAMPSFFDQIKYNTQYIIHPDEVLADNFMILALSKRDPSSLDDFDEAGKELLKKIENAL